MSSVAALLDPSVLGPIALHAEAAWPRECCGLVFASAEGAQSWVPIANIAGTDEARGQSARTAVDGYVMDPAAVLAALAAAEQAGGRLFAIVHSHPEVGAYFSREDREVALGGADEPLWPGVCYLVVSCRQGRVDEARLFEWDAAAHDFAARDVALPTAVVDNRGLQALLASHDGGE